MSEKWRHITNQYFFVRSISVEIEFGKASAQRRISRRTLLETLGASAIGFSLVSCGKADDKTAGAGKSVSSEEAKLNFYNWDTYIGETTLPDFQKATGIEVKMDLFANNDELFAKLRGTNPGYDVIMPSNDFVERMVKADLLDVLDRSLIPNAKNVSPEFMDVAYDVGRKYSLPYTWLALGIGYRKSKVKSVPDSWKWLYDSDVYKGRISLLKEAADLFRLGGKYLGHSVNGLTPEIIKQVEAMLIKQKPYVKAFHEDNGQDLLASGEVDLVLEYNGDIAQIMAEDDDIGFVIPKEGSQLNSDNMAIPKGAPHPKNAHAFMNFMLDGKNGAEIYKAIQYPTPNAAAKALMPASYKNNTTIFPPADILSKCEYSAYPGPALQQQMEDAFTRIMAA
jgi:spermidine/putrescine transport system substrate-binding protein